MRVLRCSARNVEPRAPSLDAVIAVRLCTLLFSVALLFASAITVAATTVAADGTAPVAPKKIALDTHTSRVALWPAVTLRTDEHGTLTAAEVFADATRFNPPQSAYAALGFRREVLWLRVPVDVPAAANGNWVLDIDYSLLNRIDVYISGGPAATHAITHIATLGNNVPVATRPIGSRSHATPITFIPGGEYVLMLRVQSLGSKILPISLSTPAEFHRVELNEQLLQGLFTGLGIFLLLFSLLQWLSLRESQYPKYALLIVGSVMFSVHFFGIGEMVLWTDNAWVERHLAGISALIAACGTALFIEDTLRAEMSLRMRRAIKILAALLALPALLHALDLLDIRGVSVVMVTIGLLPSVFGVPGALTRMRRGDSVGAYFLLAWVGYFIASAIMIGVVTGRVGANFWSMHSFQFGATLDMLIFMRIAALRSARLRRTLEAERRQLIEGQKVELEKQVGERTQELALEREKSESLLRNMLPAAIADALKRDGKSEPKRHDNASILITDIVDFTKIVADIPPSLAVNELNEIFIGFDAIVARNGLEKINTVGDAYLAAAGVPEVCDDHALRCVRAATEMIAWLSARNHRAGIAWHIRAGIHSGPVVSGVVGSARFAFGVWGDTVNVASRLESASEPDRINISAATHALVNAQFACEYRGKHVVKGKGEIDMYFIVDATEKAVTTQ